MRNSTNDGVEIHLIKTIVTLKKVNITVRFPCSISFALKYETNVVEHQNVHELRNGQCLIGQSIEMQLEVPYQNGKYDQKKMSLLIFMISVNGKIPAGSVSINPTERLMGDKKVGLQKCPDKNAQVTFSLNFQKVKMERMKSDFGRKGVPQVTISPSTDKVQQTRERLNTNRMMSTGTPGLFKSQVEGVYKSSSRDEVQKLDPVRMHSSRVVEVPPLRQRFSLTTSEYQVIARSPQSPANLSANLPRQKSVFHKLQNETSDFNGSRSSNRIVENNQSEQMPKNIRMTTLQRENDGFIQQISKMKKSVRDIDSQQHYSHNHQQMDDQLNLIIGKQKVQTLKLSPQISDREMNQRERLSETGSQRMQDWNKRKSRVLPLDASRGQFEVRLADKDRVINQLQNDKFKLEQSLQQERSLRVQGKRQMQIKENNYRQELKKMKDRLSQMQVQKQKAIFDCNNMQSQVQTSERKSQLTLREKERNLIDQKNKLTKKLQQVNLDCASLREAQEETKVIIAEYQAERQKTIGEFKSKQLRINELVQANKTLQSDLKSLQATNAMLKEEVEHVSSQFSDDKGSFRKKYMQAHNELTLQKDKLQKLKAANLTLETRNRELTQRLQRQTKEKNSINAKLEQTKRSQKSVQQQQNKQQKSVQSMSTQGLAQNSKLMELRNKLESEKKKYEQMQKKYEEKDQYFQQSKAEMQVQMDELKYQIKAQADKLQAQSVKNRQINEQMLEMSRRVIDMQTKAAEDEQAVNEKESRIIELEQNIEQLQIDLESAKQNLKTIEILHDALSKKQEDICLLQQGFDKNNASSVAQMQALQRTIDEHENELRNKNQEIMALHDEVDLAKEEKYKLTQNVNARVNELAIAKELNKTLTQDYASISDKFARINEEEKSRTQRLQYLEEGLSQKSGQLSSALKELQLITSQFQEFKFALKQTLQQLIEEVCRGENEQTVSVIQFKPDSQLQYLLTDCLKKHHLMVGKAEQKFLQQQNTVSVLEEELFKQQAWIQKLGEEHDENLRRQQERLKGVVDAKNKEIGELRVHLQEETQKLSEYAVEVDFLNSEMNKLEYTVEQLNRQILIHKQNENDLRQLSSEMEIQIFNLKEKDYRERVSSQAQQEELKKAFQAEIERKKDALKGLGEELKLKDRTISERSEEIKRTLSSEEQGKAERQRLIQQLKEITAKYNQEVNGRVLVEKQLKQRQKTLKELQEQLKLCKKAIDESKTRQIVQVEQLKKLKGDLYLQEDRYKLLKEDQQLRYSNVSQSEKREREKTDKLQAIKSKLQQQNLELREKSMKLQSEIEFHKFHKVESSKKIEELEKFKEDTLVELQRQKETVFKLEKEIGNYQTKLYKLQTELDNSERDKNNLMDNLQMCKEKIAELDEAKRKIQNDFANELNQMHYKIQDYDKLRDAFSNSEQQYEKTLNDTRNQLMQAREQLNLRGNLIDELQKMLEDRPCDINVEKAKWQAELQNERRELQIKMSKIEQNFLVLQQELQFQKQQSIKEIEGANSVIQELNEVVRDKEESIEYKQEVINEQAIQLQQLNLQLNECISKWEREKQAYLPTATKMNELNEQIARMNKFIIELDGRNKQLLEINKRKMQQKIETKGSITDMLKEILLLVQKNKNKLLGRCLNDKEKEQVIAEFKTLQDKLDMTLKSTQIVTIAAPKKE